MPARSVIAAIIFIRPSHAGHLSASTPLYQPQQPRPIDARPLRRRLPPPADVLDGQGPRWSAWVACEPRSERRGVEVYDIVQHAITVAFQTRSEGLGL